MKIFLATAMENQSGIEFDTVKALQIKLNKHYGETSVFLAATEFPTPDTYLPYTESYQFVVDMIDKADVFVLYYPKRVVSGALIELGYALAKGLTTLIITGDTNYLPYMIRGGAANAKVIVLSDSLCMPKADLATMFDEIKHFVQLHVTK